MKPTSTLLSEQSRFQVMLDINLYQTQSVRQILIKNYLGRTGATNFLQARFHLKVKGKTNPKKSLGFYLKVLKVKSKDEAFVIGQRYHWLLVVSKVG